MTHNEFSSLWCIKDRDPKQVERKVLSFQRHYSIPPGVKARFTIFWFLLSFRYFGKKYEVYVWIIYAAILYIYSFWFAGLGAGAPEGRAYTIGAQGGCTLLRLADFCDASRMMLAKIRALRQFSFGCFVRRTRRMKTARKKRCAIHLTRSKELFQPDARSDLLLLGPGLRPGRCGWVGSPEGSRAERVQWTKQRRHGWRCAPVFASARRGAPQKAAKRERTKRGSRNTLPPPLAQRSDKTTERKPQQKSARFRTLCALV